MQPTFARIAIATLIAHNIRTSMDQEGLERLAASLKKGQKLQILVTTSGKIIDGHRRVAAAQLAGITHLDALVVDDDLTPEQISELQTIFAFHSETLSDYDKAHALKSLKEAKGFSNREQAEHFDIDPSAVTQFLSLFACLPAVQELAAQGKIGRTKWYEVSQWPPQQQQEALPLLSQGVTREEIKRRGKRAKHAATPAVRTNRIKVPLVGGSVVTVAGDGMSLEEAIDAANEAIKQMKAAVTKGLNAKTAMNVWKDVAAAR